MLRTLVLPMFAVCALSAVTVQTAAAQGKVGVINLQRAVLETAEIKKASADLERKFKPRQDALEKAQRELNDIQTQLQASQGKISASGQADLESQGSRKQREVTRLTEDLQADVERERTDVLQRAGSRMTDVVKKLSEEKGLDMVVEVTNMVFFKPTLEITNDAIAAYDKAYPAK